MTDTLITVDLQFQKLLQRAREGQAAGREVQVDREQQRKVEAAGRAERGVRERITIPGQVLQQGRSRRGVRGGPQNVTKRPKEQPAAGYVPGTSVGSGFLLEYSDTENGDVGYEVFNANGKKVAQIPAAGYVSPIPIISPLLGEMEQFIVQDENGNNVSPYVRLSVPPAPLGGIGDYTPPAKVQYVYTFSSKSTYVSVEALAVFPVSGSRFVLSILVSHTLFEASGTSIAVRSDFPTKVVATDIFNPSPWLVFYPVFWAEPGYPGTSYTSSTETLFYAHSFLVGGSSAKPINTPAMVKQWMQDTTAEPWQASQGLGVDDYELTGKIFNLGTPRTIKTVKQYDTSVWSNVWLQFGPSKSNKERLTARKITSLDTEKRQPITPKGGRPVPRLSVLAKLPESAYQGHLYGSDVQLLAWDWGKPALCRQLLLQLGFSPSDLSP
jgi:hypothetical protein